MPPLQWEWTKNGRRTGESAGENAPLSDMRRAGFAAHNRQNIHTEAGKWPVIRGRRKWHDVFVVSRLRRCWQGSAMRLTDRQFRALLTAKYHGSAALAFESSGRTRTLISLAGRGYIEPSAPWRLTQDGHAAINEATGRTAARPSASCPTSSYRLERESVT